MLRAQISTRALLNMGVAALALTTAPAFAQAEAVDHNPDRAAATTTQSEDIVVTARRRAENLLDVPIAVTAYSGEALDRQGAIDLTDIQNTTPNTTLKDARGTNSTLAAFIRGVGQQDPVPGFEAGIGIYLDDVYLNRPQAAVLDIFDIDRIEVLRGPQGTLYGRNTIGGAIKYVTKKLPDEFEFDGKATYGSYNQADAIVTVSAPVTDLIRVGVSGARLTRDGFGRNLTLGTDNYNKNIWAGRGTVEIESPDQNFGIRIVADYTHDKSNARNGHRLIPGLQSGTPVLANVYDTQAGLNNPKEDVQAGGISMTVTGKLSEAVTLKSISAYRQDRSLTPIDFDALPAVDVDVPAVYRNEQTSQEFQLAYSSDKLNGIVGFYYLGAKAQTGFDVLLYTTGDAVPPGPPSFGPYPRLDAYTSGDVRTETESFYADFTYDFTPQLSLSLGGRYTWDQRKSTIFKGNFINGPTAEFGGNPTAFGAPLTNFQGVADFKRFTPRASLSYKITPDHLVYASYSEGFKGGGFDPRGSGASAPISNVAAGRTYQDIYNFLLFKPETVRSYELGWKGALFDRRLTFAADGFYSDYSDVQVPGSIGTVVNGIPTFVGITTNAAKARIYGAEFEGNAKLAEDFAGPGSSLTLTGTLGYIDAKYKKFIGPTGVDIASARVFQNTPKWTASGTLGAALPIGPGSLVGSTTISYRSLTHQFETASPFLDQPAYTLLDANITYSWDRFSVGVHARNLTDVRYKTSGYQYINATVAGVPILNANGGYTPTLGKEGIATAFYGNPRQVFGTFEVKF